MHTRRMLVVAVAVASLGWLLAGSARAEDETAPGETPRAQVQPVVMQHSRPHDSRSINQFEPPKEEGPEYTGFVLNWGGGFTQQFQALHHSNNATPNIVAGVNTNQLMKIGSGMNNAMANLYLNAQIAKGIRVEMTNYLSTRHHNETWVKDGFLLVDGAPWENAAIDKLMEYLTLRVGHFEVNYGDAHYRSSDGGNTMSNPLVGNLLMNAFTTEIGAEVYLRSNGLMAMAGVTNGEVRGTVERPQDRAPTYLAKLGFDRQIMTNTRVRLTGSLYTTTKSVNNTLYSGSRAGSRYFDVLVNTKATPAAQAWSGDVQPGLSSEVTAVVINPFIKCHGFEFFGNIEQAKGRAAIETSDRTWKQYSGEGLYRFMGDDLYVAGRYNTVKGRIAGMTNDVTINRIQAGGGWFITPNLMMKGEYVRQEHKDYAVTDILHDGVFEGVMVEGVVSF